MARLAAFLRTTLARLRARAQQRLDASPRAVMEELEARVLYSADSPGAWAGSAVVANLQRPAQPADATTLQAPSVERAVAVAALVRTELVFIDAAVPDADRLAESLRADAEASGRRIELHRLDAGRDGLAQISAVLGGRSDIDALHIVSHGSAGVLQLGSGRLDAAALAARADDLAAWRDALAEDADLLLYGCDFAADDAGQALVQRLAELTGADVAASTDASGSALLGGNWVLEYQAGPIERAALAADAGGPGWTALLASVPQGGETRVNSTVSGTQTEVAVAMNASGRSVVVWTSEGGQDGNGRGVYAQRYDATGTALGGEFRVNTYTSSDQRYATVAIDSAGNFVVAWVSNNQDGDSGGIYAQRFNADGSTAGAEFGVNTTIANNQTLPSVAMDGSGNFVVVWRTDQAGGKPDIYARRYNNAGTALGGEIVVNADPAYLQDRPSVAMNASGAYVIAWKSNNPLDGSGAGIFAQRYAADGTAQGSSFLVNTTGSGNQDKPTVGITANGDFAIAWVSGNNQDGDRNGVFAQRFNAAGSRQGSEFRVNTTVDDNQDFPSLAMDDSGDFTIAWSSRNQDGNGTGIYKQSYTAAGQPVALETLVNTTTSGNQDLPALAMAGDGRYVVTWTGNGSGDGAGVFLQRLQPLNAAPVNSVPAAQATAGMAPLVFSSALGNAITVSDDAPWATQQITLSVNGGVLTLATTAGLSFSSGSGSGDARMVFTGTLPALNAALDGLRFTPDAFFNGVATLQIVSNDQGAYDPGGALTDTDSVAITVRQNATPYVLSGTYTGNGIDNRAITGLGFQPDLVLVKARDDGSPAVLRTSTMSGDASKEMTSSSALRVNELQALLADGFEVGTDNGVNRLGKTYDWVAFKASAGSMTVGTYTGDGVTGRQVVGLGFSPDALFVIDAGNSESVFTTRGAGVAFDFSNTVGATAYITALGDDGFTLGNNSVTNGNGRTYHYVAWNEVPGLMDIGSYTGNNVDNRDIGGVGFQPEYLIVRSSVGESAVQRFDGQSGDMSSLFSGNVVTNRVQAMQPDGFQVGNDSNVNANGRSYSTIAWRQQTAPTISAIANQSTAEDTPKGPIAFTVGDAETALGSLSVKVESSNPTLLDAASFVFGGSGANRTLTISPLADANGSATVTVYVGDGASQSSTTFTLTVTAVNDAPTALSNTAALAAIAEDTASPVGATVNALFGAAFSDAKDQVSGGSSADAFAGVAVVANAANAGSEGAWQWFDGTTWNPVAATVSTSNALLLAPTTLLRFLPVADYHGTPGTLTVRLADNSAGALSAGSTANIGSGGGSSAYSGAADAVVLSTSVTAVNDAPVVSTTGSALSYLENAAATAVDPGLTVADVDSASLTGATVTISANYAAGQDVLGFASQNGITGSYGAGVLTLTGTATLAQYQAALRSVTYVNTSDDPSTAARTVSFVVNDGAAGSTAATRQVTVTAVNDAPTLTNGAVVTLTATDENTASSGTLVSAVLASAGRADVDGGALSGLAVTAVTGNGTWQYSTDGSSWTAFGPVSTSSALLLASGTQVRYLPDGSNGETATFAFAAWDRTSGSASANGSPSVADPGAGGGTSAWSSQRASASMTVSAVNDAPTLTPGANVVLAATDENTTAAATTVAALLAGAGHADVDTGAIGGLAITARSGSGTWQYSTDGTTWAAFGAVSSTNALLLGTGTQLRYVPDSANGETATLGFVAWDQTSGTPSTHTTPRYATPGAGGGSSAYSSASATASLAVAAVNDAPVLDATKSPVLSAQAEDAGPPAGAVGTLVSALVDVAIPAGQLDNVTDIDTGAQLGIAVVAADTSQGSWWYSTDGGSSWSALEAVAGNNARLLAADAGTRLYFQSASNWNGTLAGAVTFRAWDRTAGNNGDLVNPGAGGGTSAYSSTTDTASLVVTAVNDAPVNTVPGAQTVNEDTTLVFSAGNGTAISIADVDAGAAAVRVTLTGTNGAITLSGVGGLSFSAGSGVADTTMTFTGSVANINAALAGLSFRPSTDFNGAAALQIVTDDLGNTGSGGALSDTDTDTVAITVLPVNDAPTGAPAVAGAATEDQTLSAVTVSIADADGLGAFAYQWLRDGVAIAGATASTHGLGDADVGKRISVRVSWTDGQGTAESLTSAQTAPVANVNDAPTGVPVVTGTATENQTLTADTSGLGDADGLGAFAYQWLRGGAAITGATGATHLLVDADVGAQISVRVSWIDGWGTAETLTSAATAAVLNVNDAPTGAVLISGTASSGQTLAADTVELADEDGLGAFAYQWLSDGVDIVGETGSTLALTVADIGTRISLRVSWTDGHGSAESVTSAQTDPVTNANNAPSGAPVITGSAAEDQTLGVDTSAIADADGLGAFSYRWLRNGVAIAGATGPTYLLGDADVGRQISVRVGYSDGNGTGESLTSVPTAPVSNVNDAPTGLPVVQGTPTENQTLGVDTSAIADIDGLGPFSYQWLRDGADIVGASGASHVLGNADVGARISVRVSWNDGYGTPESVTSARTVVVANLNDAPTGVPVLTGSAVEDQVLGVDTTGLADADGLGAFGYQWMRDGAAVSGATASTYALGDADVGARIAVRVSWTDGHGTAESVDSAQTAVVANVNDAPTGAPAIQGAAVENTTLTVSTAGLGDADGLGAFGYQWLRDGVAIAGATAGTYTLVDVDIGARVSVRVSWVDGWGTAESLSSVETALVSNVNDAPTGVPVVTGSAVEDQVLGVDTSGLGDQDGLGAFSYQWLREGIAVGGATGATYTLGDADVGQGISVRVEWVDGRGSAESVTSAPTGPVLNINDAPGGAPTVTGTATEYETLSVDTSAVADDDGLGAFSYQWLRDGADIAGALGSTYTLGAADIGARISVTVAWTDSHGTAELMTSAQTNAVANVNDAPTGVPLITGSAAEDQTLGVATAGLSDADGLGAFSYQWLRGGAAIAGQTAATYTLGDADVGLRISVRVSYVDGHGTSESVTSAASAAVDNVNDAPTGQVVVDSVAIEGQVLSADTSGIADADGLGVFAYQWLRDGAPINAANGATYVPGNDDVDAQISVRVGYTDGHGTPETLTSAPTAAVSNVNDAPTGSVTIDDTTPRQGDTLTASHTLADADGLGTVGYQWRAGGVDITGATSATLVLTEAEVGRVISVVARYTDGHGTDEAVASAATAAVSNLNDAPTGAVSIDRTTPSQGDTLTASHTLADADGLGVVGYQWRADGVDITGAASATLVLTEAEVGKAISVVARYTDGHGTDEAVVSTPTAAVANVNDAPTGLPAIVGSVTEDQTLTVDTSAIVDADGLGSGGFSYQWLRGGVAVAGATSSSYALGDADVGQVISVEVRYIDARGTAEGPLTSAATAAVANVNDAPTGLPAIAGSATEDQTLTVDTSAIADADGLGSGGFSYQWLRSGTAVTGATGASYLLGDADVGQVMSVELRYTDARSTAEGPLTSAATAAVANVNDAPTGLPAIVGSVTEDQTLTVDTSAIADADGLGSGGFSYQWLRGGTAVTGATGASYLLGDADVGQVMSVELRYTDARSTAEGPLTSAATAAVANVNDAPTGLPAIVGSATEDQTLTVDTSAIADADGLGSSGFSYQWLRGGTAVTGATGASYLLGDADVGQVMSVELRYTDARGTAEGPLTSAATAAVANVNDAPTGLPAIVGSATEDQTLTVDTSAIADADGLGSSGFSYQWLRGGTAVTGATGASYLLGDADVGQVMRVEVSYTDARGTAEGLLTSAATAAVANVNDAPTGLPAIVGSATEDQTLTVDTSAIADADGQGSGGFSYQWLRDGVPVPGAVDHGYRLGTADVGSRIGVQLRYVDARGTAEGPLAAAPTAAVQPAGAPVPVNRPASGAPVIVGPAVEGQTLSFTAGGIADADGLGSGGFAVQWLRDGALIDAATGATLRLHGEDIGARISVELRFIDALGHAEGPLVSAPTAAVAAAPVSLRILSDGAGAAVVLELPEGRSAVTTVRAGGGDGRPVYSLAGGADRARFLIDPASGALSLAAAPDFEAPADADADNRYEVTVQATDGQGAVAQQRITVRVLDLAEAPSGSDGVITLDEDSVRVLRAQDFGFRDPDAGDRLGAVRIDTLPARGLLRLGEAAVTAGQVVDSAELAAGRLTWTPPPDANGTALAQLRFSVADASGLFAAQPAALRFDVAPVADAPRLAADAAMSLALPEGEAAAIGPALLRALDIDADAAAAGTDPAQLRFSVVEATLHGRLELSSAPGAAATRFTQADIDAGRLRYVHDGSESTNDRFVFDLVGPGGVVLGSVSFGIVVQPVDDAPVLTLGGGVARLQAGAQAQPLGLRADIRDADSALLASASVRLSGAGADSGRLVLAGDHGLQVQWNAEQGVLTLSGPASPAVYARALASVQWVGAGAMPGARILSLTVTDREGTVSAPVETGLRVSPVPAPEAAPAVVASATAPPAAAPVQAPSPAPAARAEASRNTIERATPAERAASADTPVAAPVLAELPAATAAAPGPLTLRTELGTQRGGDVMLPAVLRDLLPSGPVTDTEVLDALEELLASDLRRPEGSSGSSRAALADVRTLIDAGGPLRAAEDDGAFGVLASTGVGGGLLISASVLWWATRAGGLMAAMMASLPAWRSFDPLPVLDQHRAGDADAAADDDVGLGAPAPAATAASGGAASAAAVAAPSALRTAAGGTALAPAGAAPDTPAPRRKPVILEEMAGPG